MYKISVPISLCSIPDNGFEQGLKQYLSYCQAGKISRVFLTNLQETVSKSYDEEMNTEKFSRAIHFFKSHGIKTGVCMAYSTWDLEGTDGLELAKAFAGKTKPFLHLIGAPYHDKYVLTDAIENERLQAGWIKQLDNEIEVFAEGDVFPRPRYATPSKPLELFDLAHKCDRNFDGNLKYMFDYNQPVGYEPGYMEKHLKYMDIHQQIQNLFADKTGTGVQVFGAMHKIRDWNFPETCEDGIVRRLEQAYRSFTADILSKNSIPTCYAYSGYPVVAICGESARSVPTDSLQNGAVLDATAAKILAERGIDTGLLHTKDKMDFSGEYYISENQTARGLADCRTQEVVCAEGANVLSVFLPDKTLRHTRMKTKTARVFWFFRVTFISAARTQIILTTIIGKIN